MDRLIRVVGTSANPLARLADAFVTRLVPEVEANADCRFTRSCGCCALNRRGNTFCSPPGKCYVTCNGYGC